MAARFIVHADDFGYSRAVNRAIVCAHRRGALNSCSLMVSAAAVRHAVEIARPFTRLGIGLHVSLTTTLVSPPHDIPVLARMFPALLDVVDAWQAGRAPHHALLSQLEQLEATVPVGELEHEFEAQVARFTRTVGRPPTHLDTHQHVHVRPFVRHALVGVARRHGLPIRQIDPAMRDDLRANGFTTTDHFAEAPTEGPCVDATIDDFVRQSIGHDRGIVEMLFHPGFHDRRQPTDLLFEAWRPLHLRGLLTLARHQRVPTAALVNYGALRDGSR
jgi:hypothetical protein